jgi:hypothetical protein
MIGALPGKVKVLTFRVNLSTHHASVINPAHGVRLNNRRIAIHAWIRNGPA